jgi:uncharacterized membrane protein YphA (DoxX/SURF4 family)
MDNNYMLVLITSVLNLMFFVSGFDKLFHFGKVVDGLNARLGNRMPMMVYQMLIVCAIVIEIVCPIIIFYSSLIRSERNDKLAMYASIGLIVFTVVATLFYHFPPTTSAKYYPFMSNLSLVGGLSLMAMVFYNRDVLL